MSILDFFFWIILSNILKIHRMLDDFGNELDSTESKLDSTMKKVAKVLRMNNGECFVAVL